MRILPGVGLAATTLVWCVCRAQSAAPTGLGVCVVGGWAPLRRSCFLVWNVACHFFRGCERRYFVFVGSAHSCLLSWFQVSLSVSAMFYDTSQHGYYIDMTRLDRTLHAPKYAVQDGVHFFIVAAVGGTPTQSAPSNNLIVLSSIFVDAHSYS